MRFSIAWAFAIIVGLKAYAEPLNDDATFQQIFNQTVSEAASVRNAKSGAALEIEPSYSLVSLQTVTLSNAYFKVPFHESLSALSAIQMALSWGSPHIRRLQTDPLLSLGYAHTSHAITVQSKASPDSSSLKDFMHLQWLPVSAGVRTSYVIPGLESVTVFVNAALGMQWLYQTGNLDGIDQGFWMPFASLGGGAVLFDQTRGGGKDAWFGGATIGARYNFAFATSQKAKTLNIDLGLRFLL